jgi:XTP/dITP diphosphohydrolase
VIPRLVVATANAAKAIELGALLDGLGYEIVGIREYPALRLPPESATSYRDNALAKARAAAGTTGALAVGDDSGLEVDALGGRPGVTSARYGGADLSDHGRMARLLDEMAGIRARTARFRCVLGLVAPWGEEALVEGVVDGVLAESPRGESGHGYDPIFMVPSLGRTLAELSPNEKNLVSHRGQATDRARPILAGWLPAARARLQCA